MSWSQLRLCRHFFRRAKAETIFSQMQTAKEDGSNARPAAEKFNPGAFKPYEPPVFRTDDSSDFGRLQARLMWNQAPTAGAVDYENKNLVENVQEPAVCPR